MNPPGLSREITGLVGSISMDSLGVFGLGGLLVLEQ
jgi:hypothetical protein